MSIDGWRICKCTVNSDNFYEIIYAKYGLEYFIRDKHCLNAADNPNYPEEDLRWVNFMRERAKRGECFTEVNPRYDCDTCKVKFSCYTGNYDKIWGDNEV